MAFTPEDGTGTEGANSYTTLEYADDYHVDRGNAAWASAEVSQRQAALVKATDYIEQNYAAKWLGNPVSADQALSWPRTNQNGMPGTLQAATSLLALEALTKDLNPALGQAVKRKKVDTLEIEYQDGTGARIRRPAVDGMLRSLCGGGGLNIPVVRV